MKFDNNKKESVIVYLLEKIQDRCESLSQTVSETFKINQNTIHRYINELVENGTIRRIKRGVYELVYTTDSYTITKNSPYFFSDTHPYENFLKKHLSDFPKNVRENWSYAMSEIINNVIDHSESTVMNVTMFQDYLKTTVVIDDNGVGIFKKIKEHFNFETLDDAICELFKGKLTTDTSRHSGEGIFFSSRLMDTFEIYSDNKHFAINRLDAWELHDWDSAIEKKGTTVIMSLSNRSKKQLYEIFNTFSSINGGFSKTTIPLRCVFESPPVSRSQAKRVCTRLNEYKETNIDFTGIEWVGQAFMHEIFCVFSNAHKDIKIIPVGMSKNCENMYLHVINS